MPLRLLRDLELRAHASVFLRLDLNVPIESGKIQDETRVLFALPTIKFLMEKQMRVTVCSHLGRPKGAPDPKYTLEPIGRRLAELLNVKCFFSTTTVRIKKMRLSPWSKLRNQTSLFCSKT